ncbi:hypothetical protein Dsin_004195 [Dipteronia sinensis]|uniref:CCT domain-containing protein n=1 Tax=Dipteronia sinensis TaxID=43782 RepID=A0AAE0ELD6_9ROSI|nr:hypothetical protein Dsin_004195 [Dipteronia sinensis]
MSPWDQLADPPDSTCAQVIHSWPETFGNTWMPMTPTKAGKKQDGEPENVVMGKDLEIGVPRIPSLQLEDPTEKVLDIISDINKEKLSEINSKKDDEQLEKKQLEHNSDKPNGNVRNQASDLMGVITNSNDSPIESEVFDIPNGLLKESVKKEKAVYENNELLSLELSLKRQREVGDTGTSLHERNVLRHSDQHSAFSRYNSASTANQPPRGNVSSCSPLDNSSEASKRESSQNFQSNTNGTPPSQRSNGSSNNSDTGLTNDSTFTKPMVFSDKTTPKSTVKCLHPSAFRPAQNGRLSLPQPAIQGKADAAMSNTILPQVRGMNQQFQVQHHHHYYHHHHHHVRNMAPQQLAHQDDLLLKNIAVVAPLCSSSNMLSVPIEGNTGNGSTSGSYHGSNGQNGSSSSALTARRSNIESDNGVTMKGGVGDGIGYGSRSGIDKTRFAQREAALIKFRQKRKQRCFEKKVRYQSRKKLAEQRPRVRGQFIRRQAVHENKARTQIVNPSFPL